MANFDVTIVSGVSSTEWADPKIQARGVVVHRYLRVPPPTAPALAQVLLHCVVGGVDAPLDVDLGGKLFEVARMSWSGSFPFAIAQGVGQSSVIRLSFAANMLGHQEIVITREDGGAVVLSVDVEA